MTTQQYQNLNPREATPSASSRLFSFARIRSGASTRFYPGDGAKLHYANRDVDTLEIPGIPSGFLAAGDVVTANYKGVCVFRGDVATIAEHKGRGTDATQTVTCVGPWSKMQRLVYRQLWAVGGGTARSSRLVLNMTQQGNPQSLNSELTEIAGHGATACGYTVGTVSVSTQILPSDECRDITIADAIKRELRLFPRAVTRFNYASTTPALTIVKGGSAASYAAAIPKTSRTIEYNAHPITGVDLEIESTVDIEGVTYVQIDHQTAGNATAGNPDCLYATLQVKGASANTVHQSFTSITEDIPQNLNNAAWWKSKHPRLANVALNAIKSVTDGARTPSNYPRISAATAGELEEAGLHCEVSKFTCKVTVETVDHKEEDIFLTMNFLTTNATGTAEEPKTYTWTAESSAESAESVPTGLAAAILAERSGTVLGESMTVRLGDTWPKVGDTLTEDGQTLALQSFDVDCGALTAELSFGVPEYLSPEDMASLLSNFRNKGTTTSSAIRKSGKPEDKGQTVELGGIPPLSSTEFSPGRLAHLKIQTSDTGYGSIDLNSSDLDAGEEMSVQEIVVGKDAQGNDKKVKVLATEPFTPGGTLTASGTVVTGVDYVTSTGDPDYAAHAYSIRITRGRLTYNAATGALTVDDDPALKQFIATTPHSVSMDYQS